MAQYILPHPATNYIQLSAPFYLLTPFSNVKNMVVLDKMARKTLTPLRRKTTQVSHVHKWA